MTSTYVIDIAVEAPRWQKEIGGLEAWCEHTCATALDACGVGNYAPHAQLSVLFTDDQHIQTLNRQYRDKDKPTNVLSFPSVLLQPDKLAVLAEDTKSGIPVTLGDIAVSLETVLREAQEEGKTVQAHTAHMLVHAVLHLLGYDHMDDNEAENMENQEVAILTSLGVKNPYTAEHKA